MSCVRVDRVLNLSVSFIRGKREAVIPAVTVGRIKWKPDFIRDASLRIFQFFARTSSVICQARVPRWFAGVWGPCFPYPPGSLEPTDSQRPPPSTAALGRGTLLPGLGCPGECASDLSAFTALSQILSSATLHVVQKWRADTFSPIRSPLGEFWNWKWKSQFLPGSKAAKCYSVGNLLCDHFLIKWRKGQPEDRGRGPGTGRGWEGGAPREVCCWPCSFLCPWFFVTAQEFLQQIPLVV